MKELIYKDDLEINYSMGGLKWWQKCYFYFAVIWILGLFAGLGL